MGELPVICAASVTPVDIAGTVDTAKLAAHCHWLLANGCDGVVLFGTTGEAPSFGIDERRQVLESVVASGIDPQRLIVGTGCCSVQDTTVLSGHALDAGCAAVLVHPPYFFRPASDEGTFAFFVELVEALGERARDLILYHFPDATGAPIPPSVIERLISRYPGVFVGIKDSSGSFENTLELANRFPGFKVFTGDDHLLKPLLENGGFGAITATANLAPNLLGKIRDNFHSKNTSDISAHTTVSRLWEDVLLKFPISEAVKDIIASTSGDGSWNAVRPPLAPLADARHQQLSQMVAPFMSQIPNGLGQEK